MVSILLFSCEKNNTINNSSIENSTENQNSKWNIEEAPYPIRIKGPYQLMNTPSFKSIDEVTQLDDTDKVGVVSFNNTIKVYPYKYNNTYEVVNDNIGAYYYAFSYCPQTKSAINYNRIIDKDTLNLIASGYLYKENMVPSDSGLNSFWSQMLMTGITDNPSKQNINTYNHIQTNWKTIVDYFPNAQVFYSEGNVSSKHVNFVKEKDTDDNEDVFSIIENFNNSVKNEVLHAFPLSSFKEEVALKNVSVNGKNIILISSKANYFYTAYIVPDGSTFKPLESAVFPPILEDNHGNVWNAFGYALDGPNKGEQLESPKAYIASWWAWKLFYEEILME